MNSGLTKRNKKRSCYFSKFVLEKEILAAGLILKAFSRSKRVQNPKKNPILEVGASLSSIEHNH